MKFLKVKVILKDGSKIIALFDTGAKINVMIKKVMKNARLVMRQRQKQELVLYKDHNKLFLKLYKNVEVAISGLKIRHLIFVIETRDHNLVLE